MARSPLSIVLQSALVAGGTILGLCHAFQSVRESEENDESGLSGVIARLEALEMNHLAKTTPEPVVREPLVARQPVPVARGVTHLELSEALDRVSANFRQEMDSRFVAQNHAIEALRGMSAHTSEMIERLLERLDSDSEFGDGDEDLFADQPIRPHQPVAAGLRG